MTTPFEVTLINLTREGQVAPEPPTSIALGKVSADKLTSLLEVFLQIDAVQNLKIDPEIRVHTRRDHYIIRTGQGKLFLYDARRLSEPAYVCGLKDIIGEMDGSANARRTTVPFEVARPISLPHEDETTLPPPPPPAPESPVLNLVLAAVALAMAAYIAFPIFRSETGAAGPQLAELSPAERLNEDVALTGVYMTGAEAGEYGIAVLGNGDLKLFRINAEAAPSVVYAKYKLGRRASAIYLATDQPGGLIKAVGRQTLSYGGRNYERIQ